ncbi:TPA: ATPase, partial [Candidatus Bathyarchaeota archaeon]|nr:ATPase [Candidatus Bathyarchaeota archaeon]
FEKFFTPDTLSLHLKEGVSPLAKRGIPGKFKLVKVREEPCTAEELERMIREISDYVRADGESSIEINRAGAIIAQLRDYRVAIARPPFSDGLEVTVVRPIVKLTLEDYRLSKRLMDRLKSRAEGILIAGPPGSGKTTLASSLAEFYKVQGKIVKTLESPRDLQVGPDITQYGPLEGSFEKTADILLMVRPDYSIFDEVRKTSDFQIFVDMRLAGVGMVGVVHASDAIDAIQRFMGRVELGMVPHVIDTIMFVKDGEVKKVYELKLTVKVPTGMTEEDLARPVVEVRDFETGRIEYEIYTFGEENVVIPVEEAKPSPLKRLAEERVLQEVRRFDAGAEAEIVSENRAVVRVSNKAIPKLIGKNGSTISSLEKKLGIRIEVEPKVPSLGKEAKFELKDAGSALEIKLGKRRAGRIANFYVDGEFLFSATIGKKGAVKVAKDSEAGGKLLKAILEKKEIKVFI